VVDVVGDGANSVAFSSVTAKMTPEKKSLIKKLILSSALAISAVVAIVLLSSYLRSGYFVAYEDSKSDARVLIYRGKDFLWVNPTIEADSTLTREDLSLGLAREIIAQPSFSSSADARDYVNQIRDVVEQTKP
jgi:hypothetical protein